MSFRFRRLVASPVSGDAETKEGVNDGAAELRIELNRDDLRERIETNEPTAGFIFSNDTIGWLTVSLS